MNIPSFPATLSQKSIQPFPYKVVHIVLNYFNQSTTSPASKPNSTSKTVKKNEVKKKKVHRYTQLQVDTQYHRAWGQRRRGACHGGRHRETSEQKGKPAGRRTYAGLWKCRCLQHRYTTTRTKRWQQGGGTDTTSDQTPWPGTKDPTFVSKEHFFHGFLAVGNRHGWEGRALGNGRFRRVLSFVPNSSIPIAVWASVAMAVRRLLVR